MRVSRLDEVVMQAKKAVGTRPKRKRNNSTDRQTLPG